MGRKSAKEIRMATGTLTLEDVLQDRYVPETMEVGKSDNGNPHLTMYGNAGHACIRDDCTGNLVWLNSTDFVWNSYKLYCQTCHNAWRVDKKYLWPLVKEALGSDVKEPEAVSPPSKSAFEQDVETAHKHQDELQAAQDVVDKRKQAKAEAKAPKAVQTPSGQIPLPMATTGDRTAICVDCKASFEKPMRRGRPPVKCQKCGGWGT